MATFRIDTSIEGSLSSESLAFVQVSARRHASFSNPNIIYLDRFAEILMLTSAHILKFARLPLWFFDIDFARLRTGGVLEARTLAMASRFPPSSHSTHVVDLDKDKFQRPGRTLTVER